MRGGYKLIDCGGKNINAVGGVVILGIFSAILAHNGKNIKLTQFCIGTDKCNDACVNCERVNANKYRIRELYGSDYYITSDDKIERSNSGLVTRDELESYVENELDNYEVLGTDILSGNETAGKVLTTDGDGGSAWESLSGKYVRVIDAPESDVLSDELIELFKEGIFVNGEFLGLRNPVFFPSKSNSGEMPHGFVIGYQINEYAPIFRMYRIGTDGTISLVGGFIRMTNSQWVIQDLATLNGKDIPAYPASTGTFTLKCVNGAITWVQDA